MSFRLTLLVSVLVGLALGTARPATASDTQALRYLPSILDMEQALTDLPYGVSAQDTNLGDWDSALAYRIWYGDTAVYDVYVSAAVFETAQEAEGFYYGRIAFMMADNEYAADWDTQPEEIIGEGHDFRLIYWTDEYGRVSNYARLMRVACVVVLVEATGSPASDDEGYPDSDRGMVMSRVASWSNAQMARFPAPCR